MSIDLDESLLFGPVDRNPLCFQDCDTQHSGQGKTQPSAHEDANHTRPPFELSLYFKSAQGIPSEQHLTSRQRQCSAQSELFRFHSRS